MIKKIILTILLFFLLNSSLTVQSEEITFDLLWEVPIPEALANSIQEKFGNGRIQINNLYLCYDGAALIKLDDAHYWFGSEGEYRGEITSLTNEGIYPDRTKLISSKCIIITKGFSEINVLEFKDNNISDFFHQSLNWTDSRGYMQLTDDSIKRFRINYSDVIEIVGAELTKTTHNAEELAIQYSLPQQEKFNLEFSTDLQNWNFVRQIQAKEDSLIIEIPIRFLASPTFFRLSEDPPQ